jgi:hypothetical protein
VALSNKEMIEQMRSLLKEAKPEDLFDFLEEYAERDAKFENALRVRFSEPDFQVELDKMSAMIDDALEDVSDQHYYGRWGSVNINTAEILIEIKQREKQGKIRLAFAELETLYRKLLEVFEYQDECEISDEAEYCLNLMSDVAKKATDVSDKEYIYEHCIDLAYVEDGKNYGADYEEQLLGISAHFVTRENRTKLDDALTEFETGRYEEEIKLIHLEMTRRLEGNNAAKAFIEENLKFPKIRGIAYEKAVSKQNYTEAERLCLDALSTYTGRDVLPWLNNLFTVYEHMNKPDKQAETAERLLLLGEVKHYEILKTLLVDSNRWEDEYHSLLQKCSTQLYYSVYMSILNKENEFELLLEQLRLHPEQVYKYGIVLAIHFENDVRDIFLAKIESEAKAANTRDAYQKVSEHIRVFADAGYDVTNLVNELLLSNKRRPAFVEELGKVKTAPEVNIDKK